MMIDYDCTHADGGEMADHTPPDLRQIIQQLSAWRIESAQSEN
jgi:hypothetical protein